MTLLSDANTDLKTLTTLSKMNRLLENEINARVARKKERPKEEW